MYAGVGGSRAKNSWLSTEIEIARATVSIERVAGLQKRQTFHRSRNRPCDSIDQTRGWPSKTHEFLYEMEMARSTVALSRGVGCRKRCALGRFGNRTFEKMRAPEGSRVKNTVRERTSKKEAISNLDFYHENDAETPLLKLSTGQKERLLHTFEK